MESPGDALTRGNWAVLVVGFCCWLGRQMLLSSFGAVIRYTAVASTWPSEVVS